MMHKKGGRRKRGGVNISEERETEFPATKPKRMDTKKKEGFPKKKESNGQATGNTTASDERRADKPKRYPCHQTAY